MYLFGRSRIPRSLDALARSTTKSEGRLVLVVEDDPDTRELVSDHLRDEGFEVCMASDGETAMQMIRQRAPDVLCLDLNLPRISGYDVCEQIRADPAISGISILITSARNALDVRVFSLEAGADAYLIKPFGLEQLAHEIEKLVELRAPSVAVPTPLPRPGMPPSTRRTNALILG
jgi:DNA-binding response OmpR family regulator